MVFEGGLISFNCTADHTPVLLISYAELDIPRDRYGYPQAPYWEPLDQSEQVDGDMWPPTLFINDFYSYDENGDIKNDVTGEPIKKSPEYKIYQRLVFGGNTIWDSKSDDRILDQVEVLTGNKIAILTHTEDANDEEAGNRAGRSPQSLTVYNSSGDEVFTLKADWVFPDDVREHQAFSGWTSGRHAAVIETCSDRWIHVRMFPLDVEKHTPLPRKGQEFTPGANILWVTGFHRFNTGLPEGYFPSWLISLDGTTKVPARLDPVDEINHIRSDGVTGEPAFSWASGSKKPAWGDYATRADAARDSSVIDTVSPGTMHPASFF